MKNNYARLVTSESPALHHIEMLSCLTAKGASGTLCIKIPEYRSRDGGKRVTAEARVRDAYDALRSQHTSEGELVCALDSAVAKIASRHHERDTDPLMTPIDPIRLTVWPCYSRDGVAHVTTDRDWARGPVRVRKAGIRCMRAYRIRGKWYVRHDGNMIPALIGKWCSRTGSID